jgi:hypothetical protein
MLPTAASATNRPEADRGDRRRRQFHSPRQAEARRRVGPVPEERPNAGPGRPDLLVDPTTSDLPALAMCSAST